MTTRKLHGTYFQDGVMRDWPQDGVRPAYRGLVLGEQPGSALVARCPHLHDESGVAARCAQDIAHHAALPDEVVALYLEGHRSASMERARGASPARIAAALARQQALAQALDDCHTYLKATP